MACTKMRGELLAGKTYSLPPTQIEQIELESVRRGVTASTIVREAFDEYLATSATRPQRMEEKIDIIEAGLGAVLESVVRLERDLFGEDS